MSRARHLFAPLAVCLNIWTGGAANAAMAVVPEAAKPAVTPDFSALGYIVPRDRWQGLALYGYDPVSYHTDAAPQRGGPDHLVVWSGVIWRFASAANKAAFLDAPHFYAPAYGGLDPTALVNARQVEGNPHFYVVEAGALVLFRSAREREDYLARPALYTGDLVQAAWARLNRPIALK